MNYKITFNATNTKGEIMKTLTMVAGPFCEEDLSDNHRQLALQRFCVEYARLVGVKCSFANILSVVPFSPETKEA